MAQMESTLAAADREHAARVAGILRKLKVSRHPLHRLGGMGLSLLVMASSGLTGLCWLDSVSSLRTAFQGVHST